MARTLKKLKIHIQLISFIIVCLIPQVLISQTNAELESKMDSFYYSNLDSLLFYANQLESNFQKLDDFDTVYWIKFNKIDGSSYHFDKEKNKILLDEMETFLIKNDEVLSKSKNYALMQANYKYMLGTYYYELNDFNKASKEFKEIVKDLEQNNNTFQDGFLLNTLTNSINTLGQIATNEIKFEEANLYFQQSISQLTQSSAAREIDIYNTEYIYASSLIKQEKYQEAKALLLNSLAFNLENTKSNLNRINTISSYLSDIYSNLNMPDSSWHYIQFQEKNIDDKHPFNEDLWKSKANYFKVNQKDSLAIDAYKKAVSYSENKWNSSSHPKVVILYSDISKVFVTNNKLDSALLYLNKGIEQLNADPYSSNFHNIILLELLNTKAAVLNRKGGLNNIEKSLKISKESVQLIEILKSKFISNEDEIAFVENSYSTYHNAITSFFKKQELKPLTDKENIKLFQLFEKSKSSILLSAFYNTKAYEIAGVPVDLIEKEKQLKTEITQIENQKNGIKDSQKPQLFELQNKLSDLIVEIENEYPRYFDLKYSNQTTSLKEAQEKLKNEQVLLSYFYGQEKIFCIALSKRQTTQF